MGREREDGKGKERERKGEGGRKGEGQLASHTILGPVSVTVDAFSNFSLCLHLHWRNAIGTFIKMFGTNRGGSRPKYL